MPQIRLTWLGHAGFRCDSPSGRIVLIDPWLENPCCPAGAKELPRVDAILVTHGHDDHLGNTAEIAARSEATVVGIYELVHHLGRKGVANLVGMNLGGTIDLGGIRVTMVRADHSAGVLDGETTVYCGNPAGFVVRFENGTTLYHAGDTALFGDLALIGRRHHLDVALLPIGGLFTMAPTEAAEAARMLGAPKVVPMHWGTFPALAGTPGELRDALGDAPEIEVVAMEPGETVLV
jgi:L-ascorbate metabolism protein UlaG (beta-lactamase superfamily)